MKIELDDKLIKKIKRQLNIIVFPSIFMLVGLMCLFINDRPLFITDYNMQDWGTLIMGFLNIFTGVILVQINVNYEYLKEIKESLEV